MIHLKLLSVAFVSAVFTSGVLAESVGLDGGYSSSIGSTMTSKAAAKQRIKDNALRGLELAKKEAKVTLTVDSRVNEAITAANSPGLKGWTGRYYCWYKTTKCHSGRISDNCTSTTHDTWQYKHHVSSGISGGYLNYTSGSYSCGLDRVTFDQ